MNSNNNKYEVQGDLSSYLNSHLFKNYRKLNELSKKAIINTKNKKFN